MSIHVSLNLLLHLQELVIVPVIVFIPFVTVVPLHVELVDIPHKIGGISDGNDGAVMIVLSFLAGR